MPQHGDTIPSARESTAATQKGRHGESPRHLSGFGVWLRQQRESHGYSITDLSRRLKIQSFYVEALEREDFAALPGRPYAIGYVRSIAQLLNLPVNETVVALRDVWPDPEPSVTVAPLQFPQPGAERRLPVNAMVSVLLALSIGAYAYWYLGKSEEIGRPLLSPVAELENEPLSDFDRQEARPAPGPLQLLGVPVLAESVDAVDALSPDALAQQALAARIPLPQAPLPRPRPDTDAAAVFLATYAVPVPEGHEVASAAAPASRLPQPASQTTEGLPKMTALTAYLPAVKLRGDLGPLRAGLQPAIVVQTPNPVPTIAEPPPEQEVARTQAFAAVPPSSAPLQPINGAFGYSDRRSVDPMSALPAGAPRNSGATASSVTIVADETCWIEIHDSRGRALTQRLLEPGQSLQIPHKVGLTLTAGNAGGIRVLVDGVTAPPLGGPGQVIRGVALNPHVLLAQ